MDITIDPSECHSEAGMNKQYSEEFTVLLFAAGDREDPFWDWACVSHQHDHRNCRGNRRCDYCWLNDEVSNSGAGDLFLGDSEVTAGRVVRITGKLWSARYDSIDGVDYDVGFEPSLIEELQAMPQPNPTTT